MPREEIDAKVKAHTGYEPIRIKGDVGADILTDITAFCERSVASAAAAADQAHCFPGEIYEAAKVLVDSVEKYVRQECSRSTLLSMKDKLKELLNS